MEIIIPVLTFLFGFILAGILARYRYAAEYISKTELEGKYIYKEVADNLQIQNDIYKEDLNEKEKELREMGSALSANEQILANMEDKLETQKEELAALQQKFTLEFENIANRLLEEKSQKFTLQNQTQIEHILRPLKDKIKNFEESIERKYLDENKERISLKKEIEQLRDLNLQLSMDANNLVAALKGDNKTQGDWGEFQLEMLLEKAGLKKDIHYQKQNSFKNENGQERRPDFIINLPEKKHLVIDAKVSLKAYEAYFNAENPDDAKRYLKAHVDSVKHHIKDLYSKNYQYLYQINSPDYLLLFIPIEPAFSAALQQDNQLFLDALDKNIVLVTASTLLATLRTVSFIWKQEKQKKNVQEIARQSGKLYDKFCNFIDDLKSIGKQLDQAQTAYDAALNKLYTSTKKGDTLIGRAEKIKALGAKTTKALPKELLDASE